MCVHVCVCVCVRACVRACVLACVCVCVLVLEREESEVFASRALVAVWTDVRVPDRLL